MSLFPPLFLLAAAFTPEAPYDVQDRSNPDFGQKGDRYESCVEAVRQDIDTGRMIAEQWVYQGGGARAVHCLAVADLAAGFPKLAALRLIEASERPDAGDILTRARLLEQAAQAWLEGEEPRQALDAIQQAIKLAPNAGELSLTAGIIYAANEKWRKTIEAVTAAQEQGFTSTGGFVARARAYKALLKNRQAAEDVVAVLKIDPFDLDALVLRGELQQLGVEINANYKRKTAP